MTDYLTSEARITEMMQDTLSREARIGVTQSLLELMQATSREKKMVVSLKTLYSDFVVRELSPLYQNGEPLTLELSAGAAPAGNRGESGKKRPRDETESSGEQGKALAAEAREEERKRALAQSIEAIAEALQSVLSEEDTKALRAGLEEGAEKIVLQHVESKEKRSQVHQAVKAHLHATHLSSTENGLLTIAKATAAGRREQRQRSNPLRQRTFLHFTVYKENMDSSQAFRLMAKHLHISTRQIEFCGTKDKRAVTLQRVAIRDMDPSRIQQLNHRSFGPRQTVRCCGFQVMEKGLRLGDASGNHFSIILRLFPQHHVVPSDADLKTIEKTLADFGALNYFGPQRFGTTDILTSDIGIALLQGKMEDAILSMLQSKATFVPEVLAAIEPFRQHQFREALDALPHFCMQEKDMLRHLVQHPNDYLGTLQTIPRTLAMLYFHAVQSLIWNCMASKRLCDPTRTKPEAGDIVLEKVYEMRMAAFHQQQSAAAAPGGGAAEEESSPHQPSHPPLPLIPLHDMIREEEETKLPAVRCLSSGDPLHAFALSDVVLPVPGPDTALVYPMSRGCTRDDYSATVRAMGIEGELIGGEGEQTGKLAKVFHFHGTYRPLLVRPERVKFALLTAPHWNAPLLSTDLEKHYASAAAAAVQSSSSSSSPPSSSNEEEKDKQEGTGANTVEKENASGTSSGKPERDRGPPIHAVQVDFSLPPGCYATSVLREFAVFSLHTHNKPETAATTEEAEVDPQDMVE